MKRKLIIFSALATLLVFWAVQSVYLSAGQWQGVQLKQPELKPALDVPYVPTPHEVVRKMLSLAEVNKNDILYDLGCGDGRIVVTAAKEYKIRKGVGVDIDPERISESKENAREAGVTDRVTFLQKNLFEMDFSEASVLSMYLLPSVNLKLRPKILSDMKPGSRIVSHDFDMGDWTPDKKVDMKEHTLYFWVVPANVNGDWNWNFSEEKAKRNYVMQLKQSFQNIRTAELSENGINKKTMRDIKLTGDRLEFTVDDDVNGLKGPVNFVGMIKDNTITGTVESATFLSGGKKKWTAKRKASTIFPLDSSDVVNAGIN
jgi:ubiquinone/menaquinone biosynthesis C-methylase UbiE